MPNDLNLELSAKLDILDEGEMQEILKESKRKERKLPLGEGDPEVVKELYGDKYVPPIVSADSMFGDIEAQDIPGPVASRFDDSSSFSFNQTTAFFTLALFSLVLILFNPSSPGPWTLVPIGDGMAFRGEAVLSYPPELSVDDHQQNKDGLSESVEEEPIKPFTTLKFREKYNVSGVVKNDTLIFQSNYPEKTLLIQSHIGKEYLRKQFDEDSVYIALEQVLDKYDLPDNTQLTVKLLAKGSTVYEGH